MPGVKHNSRGEAEKFLPKRWPRIPWMLIFEYTDFMVNTQILWLRPNKKYSQLSHRFTGLNTEILRPPKILGFAT